MEPHGSCPSPRHLHAATVYEGRMYVGGGYSRVFHGDLFEYDFGTCLSLVPA
jgi:hypothetical protein